MALGGRTKPFPVPMVHLKVEGVRRFRIPRGKRNAVKTARYTWWDFVPRNLCEQLSKLSNLYFLAVGLFQMIPYVSLRVVMSMCLQSWDAVCVWLEGCLCLPERRLIEKVIRHSKEIEVNNNN